jgi:pimeloyl-ACP methyl ester carboxylesterase
MSLTDHAGVRLTHGTPRVNGVEIHYAIGGAGEPVFLLHGVPRRCRTGAMSCRC